MTTDQGQPQRTATRAPVGRTVRLQFDDSMEIVEGVCKNISIGGMFIAVESSRPQGSLVRFELVLDESSSVRGLGEVVWMRARKAGTHDAGIGLKFRFLEQRDRQQIFRMVSQHIKQRLESKDQEEGFEPLEEIAPAPEAAGPPPPPTLEEEPPPPPASAVADEVGGVRPVTDPQALALDESALEESGAPEGPTAALYTGSAGQVTAPRRRRGLPWLPIATLALLLAVAGTALWKTGFFDEQRPLDMPPELEAAEPAGPAGSVPGSASTAGEPQDAEGPSDGASGGPAPPRSASSAAESRSGEAAPASDGGPTAAPPGDAEEPPSDYFTRVVDISWSALPGGLRVTIFADGAIPQARVHHFRLDGAPPREVIRLVGVGERFSPATLTVGGPAVERIRTGVHRRDGAQELHVVLDLADTAAAIDEIRHLGSRLEVDVAG